jgi:hypothetical protein
MANPRSAEIEFYLTHSIRHVSNAPSAEPEVLVHGRSGERLVAAGDPQPVQDPAVAGLPVGPGGVALIAQRLEHAEQGLEFEQRDGPGGRRSQGRDGDQVGG